MSMRDLLARLWRGLVLVTVSALMLIISIFASLDLIEQTAFHYPLVAYLLGALVVLLCYVVHELGHAIGPWLVGWRVHLMAVGFVGYAPQARLEHLGQSPDAYDRELLRAVKTGGRLPLASLDRGLSMAS